MSFEKSKEQLSSKPENLANDARNALKNIQSLAGNIDIDQAFPRMKELMNTADSSKTFRKISDASQVCE